MTSGNPMKQSMNQSLAAPDAYPNNYSSYMSFPKTGNNLVYNKFKSFSPFPTNYTSSDRNSNYVSNSVKYGKHFSAHEKDSDSTHRSPKEAIGIPDRLEFVTPTQTVDPMVKFRLKLLRICKQMTRNDMFYFHHQMKRHFASLTDDVQEPHVLFNLLIKHGDIGPHNTELLEESLFALKRHDLISILTNKQKLFQKPAIPSFDRDTSISDKFVLQLCNQDISPDNLCQLAVNGFKLPFVVLQRAKYDSKTTVEASLSVFSHWRQQAPYRDVSMLSADSMPPYTKEGLARALKDAQLNYILHKYFN